MLALADRFVPVADEVFRLQRGSGPECRVFQSFADYGHYRAKGGTRQGVYVCTPSGKLLSSVNSLRPGVVLSTMRNGLEKWKSLSEPERSARAEFTAKPVHRWEDSFPVNGLSLEVIKRDLELSESGTALPGSKWNRDYAWFSRDEVKQILPAAYEVGKKYALPDVFSDRLMRFHLVDNVVGQSIPFDRESVGFLQMHVEVLEQNASAIRMKITGKTCAESDGTWRLGDNTWKPDVEYPHGMTTTLFGYGIYNRSSETFTSFDLIALGKWSGRTQFNGRRDSKKTGTIGMYFALLAPTSATRIPPAFVNIYDADWILHP